MKKKPAKPRKPKAAAKQPAKRSAKKRAAKPKARTKAKPKAKASPTQADRAAAYRAHRERARKHQAEKSDSGRDIGEIPPVADKARRKECKGSLMLFCETYHPEIYFFGWSEDHKRVVAKLERAIKHGGRFAMAMPRGTGKSNLCETACEWALLNLYRRHTALIGAEGEHAEEMLDSVRTDLETNELLLADYPEVCYPIACLEGIHQRKLMYRGRLIRMKFSAKKIVLPMLDGSEGRGGIVQATGLLGRVRGMKHKLDDGSSSRPDLALIDDPQTDESANSDPQCDRRERVIAGAVLGLSGPGKRISAVMPCTVIRQGDLADRALDRKKHPEWNGERTKLIYAFPKRSDLWEAYADIRRDDSKPRPQAESEATEFYRQNREAMDDGAEPAWPQRFDDSELSAVQNVMNLKIDLGEVVFSAEYQNDPIDDAGDPDVKLLTSEQIAARTNGLAAGKVMTDCQAVTGFVDVQKRCLYYVLCGWRSDFTGHVLEYGTWPDQRRNYFALREVTRTLQRAKPGAGIEGAIHHGLAELTQHIFGRSYEREDGAELKPNLVMVDANWGVSTSVVRDYCRRSPWGAALLPAHGRFVGATSRPLAEYTRRKGERAGHYWKSSVIQKLVHVLFDINYWKSFVHERLGVPLGDRGCLTLYGSDPRAHRMLGDHLTAETRTSVTAGARTVEQWKERPDKPDNHLFDCLVGSAVAASVMGVKLQQAMTGEARPRGRRQRKRVRYG